MGFCYCHCFDGFNKEMALFVSPQRICDRKYPLCIAALVPAMAKENSKMGCVFFNEICSLCTGSNISDHLSKVVNAYVLHSSILVLLIFAV
jgi:hypothetical protein